MSDKFLSYGRQTISDDDVQAVVEALKGDYLTQGPGVDRFENELKRQMGCKHAVALNSGTAALHLAYAALNVGPKDAVIVPAMTFAATANAALYCGAVPVFADVNPQSGLTEATHLDVAIQKAKKQGLRPKVLSVVHYAGLPVEMGPIVDLAKSYDMKIVEDACHAIGGEYRKNPSDSWKKVGNWGPESSAAALSFHPVKHVATGEGGAVATNDDHVAEKIRLLRTHGITKNPNDFKNKDMAICPRTGQVNPWYMEMHELGLNYRIPDINAVLGESQTKKLPESIRMRRTIAGWYMEVLTGLPLELPVYETENARHAWHLYPIKIDYEKVGRSRAEVMQTLKELNIGTQVHYLPVSAHPYYRALGYDIPPQALSFYNRQLSLPMYPALTQSDIGRVADGLRKALKS
jgi:UDP-4-amino-4,6-dideoxy-N-acetyl-beta-L-altrosamine transaminase